MGLTLRYMGPEEFSAFWDEREAQVKPFIDEVREQMK